MRPLSIDLPELLTYNDQVLKGENPFAGWSAFRSIWRTPAPAAHCSRSSGAPRNGP
jgi:hypothetical protein